jgi:hypothetical protein
MYRTSHVNHYRRITERQRIELVHIIFVRVTTTDRIRKSIIQDD